MIAHTQGAEAAAEAVKACAGNDERQQQPRDRRSPPASITPPEAGGRSVEMAECFAAMDNEVLSRRGRIVADLAAPHFVTQCNGGAASILKAGAWRITSRRIKGLCETAADGSKLARACHSVAQKETLRAYLSIIVAGRRVPLVVQQTELEPGHLALEVLLFATDECHPRLVSDVVFESILTRVPSRESSPEAGSIVPARSKEFDLRVKIGPCEDEIESSICEIGSILGPGSALPTAVIANGECGIDRLKQKAQTCSLFHD
jgi:hypothetical protein